MIKWIKNKWSDYRRRKAFKKRLKELKKQDPFIYD